MCGWVFGVIHRRADWLASRRGCGVHAFGLLVGNYSQKEYRCRDIKNRRFCNVHATRLAEFYGRLVETTLSNLLRCEPSFSWIVPHILWYYYSPTHTNVCMYPFTSFLRVTHNSDFSTKRHPWHYHHRRRRRPFFRSRLVESAHAFD
jgi:hypothetical protein